MPQERSPETILGKTQKQLCLLSTYYVPGSILSSSENTVSLSPHDEPTTLTNSALREPALMGSQTI